MAQVLKMMGRGGKKLAHWYGKIRLEDNARQRVKLFTDKIASERRLIELQHEADQRAAGVITAEMEHAGKPLIATTPKGEKIGHIPDYLAALRLEKLNDETVRIATWTLDRLVEWGKWRRITDISTDSMRSILTTLNRRGKTASYSNKFIMRAKAFVHWLQREGRIVADPLVNLKRVDERNGKKTRARRALNDIEMFALLAAAPPDRREKYAWAIFAGMRRSELAKVRWGDLRLNALRPFIQLRTEQTKNGKADVLPIHPYLLSLINQRIAGMPEALVVASGVTEGYSHARIEELFAAIEKLPAPSCGLEQAQAAKTGTDDVAQPPTDSCDSADHLLDQTADLNSHQLSLSDGHSVRKPQTPTSNHPVTYGMNDTLRRYGTTSDLLEVGTSDIVENSRPSTQVGYGERAKMPGKSGGFSDAAPPAHQNDSDADLAEVIRAWPMLTPAKRRVVMEILVAK
jgi:hypothetical protein